MINGPDGGTVNRLVFDPTDSSIVYAGASNGLFRSADGGRHWAGAPPLLGTTILDVAVAHGDPRVVFAASTYGLYRTTDRGSTWHLVNASESFRVAVSAQNPNVVYSVSFSGPVKSTDGGVTFATRGAGLPSGAGVGYARRCCASAATGTWLKHFGRRDIPHVRGVIVGAIGV